MSDALVPLVVTPFATPAPVIEHVAPPPAVVIEYLTPAHLISGLPVDMPDPPIVDTDVPLPWFSESCSQKSMHLTVTCASAYLGLKQNGVNTHIHRLAPIRALRTSFHTANEGGRRWKRVRVCTASPPRKHVTWPDGLRTEVRPARFAEVPYFDNKPAKFRCEYATDRAWRQADRKCSACQADVKGEGELKVRSLCCQVKRGAAYATDHDWSHSERVCDVCNDCGDTYRVCSDCHQSKTPA